MIDDESNNTESGTGTSDQAVSKGEERAGIPLLHALRQDLSRGHSGPCLRTGAEPIRALQE